MKNKKSGKSILDSKPLWMLISLLISLSIWTYVVSTENSTVTTVFRGVPVEIVGDDRMSYSLDASGLYALRPNGMRVIVY